MIHPLANVWGDSKRITDVRIGAFCDIGDCDIGPGSKVQCHASIPPGWTIGKSVFIGPGAHFANDKYISLGTRFEPLRGLVEDDVVIGMGALIGAGLTLGKGCVVGMGAVVTKSIPPGETWVGNPARKLERP